MSDGRLTHDAHKSRQSTNTNASSGRRKGPELDFRDSWMFNVAAYKLDRLLDSTWFPSVSRARTGSLPAAITWWVDDVLMDEGGPPEAGRAFP